MIALDASYSADSQPTGVGLYSHRLLHSLAASHPATTFSWCYRPHRFFKNQDLPPNCNRRLLLEAGPLAVPAPKLFHGLNQRLPLRKRSPSVATFHDLFVLSAEYSTIEFRARFASQAKNAADYSELIIAVSEFTASQVTHYLGVPRSRIRVIPHGLDPVDPLIGEIERRPVILHVGAIQKRKNLTRLVQAFRKVPGPWELHLAGSLGFAHEEVLAAIEKSPNRDRIRTPGYLSPPALEAAYRSASIFAFPSLDEGFGIPVLEAMAHGLPVVTSNRSALPEAAGGAAWLINPDDTDALSAALKELCDDAHLRAEYIARGYRRIMDCNWQNAADATWNVYRELLGA